MTTPEQLRVKHYHHMESVLNDFNNGRINYSQAIERNAEYLRTHEDAVREEERKKIKSLIEGMRVGSYWNRNVEEGYQDAIRVALDKISALSPNNTKSV